MAEKAQILDLMDHVAKLTQDDDRARAYDESRYVQLAKARRARRCEILDREMPGVLSTIGRRTAIEEHRPLTIAADLVLSWACKPVSDLTRITPALCIVGERGHGKTVGAAWLIADTDGRYAKAEDLVRLSRAQFGEERERWESLVSARWLVVDEIGAETSDLARVRAMLESLIDQRQSPIRRTLLLGNISRAEFRERLSDRAESRWSEVGYTIELKAGRDMRRRA